MGAPLRNSIQWGVSPPQQPVIESLTLTALLETARWEAKGQGECQRGMQTSAGTSG